MSSSIDPASSELHPAVISLAPLLAQTPPGQVAKVYHDLRVLLERSGVSGASEQLRAAAWPVLSKYNTQQLITVKAPSATATTGTEPAAQASVQPLIISEAGAWADEEQAPRFVDPRTQTCYAFDPLRLRLADPTPIVVNDAYERLRAALDMAATTYTSHYYQDGVTSTFVQVALEPESEPESTIPAPNEESTAPDVAEPETATQESAVLEQERINEATPNVESEQSGATGIEAHAGGAKDAEDVARAHQQVEDSQESDHNVAGTQTDVNEAEADSTSAVNAAVDQAEAAIERDATASETKDREADEGSLADSLQQARISPERAEQEAETEAIENEQPVQQPRLPKGAPTYTIHIVGNRYNLTNFWAGRWRSTYVLSLPDPSEGEELPEQIQVRGKVQVQVHYFEEGNVQLSAEHAPTLPVATQDLSGILSGEATGETYTTFASAVLCAIKADEQNYHAALESTLSELSDKTFRALRRQLPVTKQKIDWDRAVSYNLAGDLAR